jgi:pimeloyl-ACP methyl ester carboxylesterase
VAKSFVLGLLLACAFAGIANAAEPVITDPVYARPAQLVDVGHGRRMNLYCTGQGSPTVIMDAGLGDSTISWALVQPTISRRTRTCSFDRAGLGFSDAATRAGTPENAADDLHHLLQAAGIKPPYVLVAHSLGGLNARVFADRFRSEVVGMVMVEASHEDQFTEGWAIGAPDQKAKYEAFLVQAHGCIELAQKGLVPGTPDYKRCIGDDADPRFSETINAAQRAYATSERWQAAVASERENVAGVSCEQVRATRKDYGDMPLFVLIHSPYPKRDDETQAERDLRTLSWERLHTRMAAMSSRGVNMIVPDSTHYIQYDRPQVVVDAVLQAITLSGHQGEAH